MPARGGASRCECHSRSIGLPRLPRDAQSDGRRLGAWDAVEQPPRKTAFLRAWGRYAKRHYGKWMSPDHESELARFTSYAPGALFGAPIATPAAGWQIVVTH
jgi:hypothetical protein